MELYNNRQLVYITEREDTMEMLTDYINTSSVSNTSNSYDNASKSYGFKRANQKYK